jgi:hypothetical protein
MYKTHVANNVTRVFKYKEGTENVDKNNLLLVTSSFHHVKHGEEVPSRGEIETTREYLHVFSKTNEIPNKPIIATLDA